MGVGEGPPGPSPEDPFGYAVQFCRSVGIIKESIKKKTTLNNIYTLLASIHAILGHAARFCRLFESE